MRKLIAAAAVTGVLSVTACGPSSTAAAPPAPAASAKAAAALPSPSAAVALGPLKLARFPATASGEAAKGICGTWQELRREYAAKAAAGTPYQLNQWFSSAAWHKAWKDADVLGNDPAYSNLETALGVALTGDMAGASSISAMDRACAKGD